MALARDLSGLPPVEHTQIRGVEPDTDIRFADILAKSWQREAEAQGRRPHAVEGTRFRHSDAGKCARAIAFAAAGIPQSNPMDLTGHWNTQLGTMLHDLWQDVLVDRYPTAEVEVKVNTFADMSGHVDAVIKIPMSTHSHIVIAYELKTIGGYGFKMAVGAQRGRPADGPRHEHLVQASLNALAVDADQAVLGYLAKEVISVGQANGRPDWARFCAEWTIARDLFEKIAKAEVERITGILNLLDEGYLAACKFTDPELPKGHQIVDPAKGRWELRDANNSLIDTGTWWACAYCPYQDTCAKTPSGRVPITAVPVELRTP